MSETILTDEQIADGWIEVENEEQIDALLPGFYEVLKPDGNSNYAINEYRDSWYICGTPYLPDDFPIHFTAYRPFIHDRVAYQALTRDLAIAQQALEDIINPIGKMRRELQPGYTLDGVAACRIAETPSHLQGIAREALRMLGTRNKGEVDGN